MREWGPSYSGDYSKLMGIILLLSSIGLLSGIYPGLQLTLIIIIISLVVYGMIYTLWYHAQQYKLDQQALYGPIDEEEFNDC